MWIVKLALRRPYTFAVLAIAIVIAGIAAFRQTPKDIFPEINIPVVSVIWTYNGLSAEEFEKQLTVYSEFSLSANVNDLERIESQTLDGVGIVKLFFHPGANVDLGIAQATAVSQAILRRMPPGVQPPIILRYAADSVPIIQMSLSSDTLSESELYTYGIFRIRQQLATINGLTLPAPFGGKVRQIMVDLDPAKLQAKGLSARDVNNAINAQNLTLPSGTAKIGDIQYKVKMNNTPNALDALNNIPIKVDNGVVTYVRDVAHVHDGFEVQPNVVRANGKRAVLLQILKNGHSSTLDIIKAVKEKLPQMQAAAPPGMKIELLADQSLFVQAALDGVVKEGLIAAALTATFILLFLGSWRSTLIVAISIPLSVLASLGLLSAIGHTLNVMTLGGLALAIGILVDEATITIENIHRHLELGSKLRDAILEGSREIAVPALVSALAISIVFVPVIFLVGPAKFLFTPMALAVVFAILSSYALSRTLVPVLVKFILRNETHDHSAAPANNLFARFQRGFVNGFEALRLRYVSALRWALVNRPTVFVIFALIVGSSFLALPWVGRDFFPTVDAGQFRLHVRAATGTRIETTEQIFSAVEDEIRRTIPTSEIKLILDNFGVVSEKYSLAFGDNATIGSHDGEILVQLNHDRSKHTPEYMEDLRKNLATKFPELTFYFQPADIVSQILNFGLPAPINVKVAGYNRDANYVVAKEIRERIARIPGAQDVFIHQSFDAPTLNLEVNRTLLVKDGLNQRDIAQDVLVNLSSSTQVSPNYWVDPAYGIPFLVAVQTPPHLVDSVNALMNLPVSARIAGTDKSESQLLANLAGVSRGTSANVVNHYNIQPVFDIFANVSGRDLGAVAAEVDKIVADAQKKLTPGNSIFVRGQVDSMNTAFTRMGLGLILSALLVYFLMVVNFQSWSDPFIILMALPGAFTGIVWGLFLTQTTFNVPSLMGAIMTIGVATANSILMVTFANDQLRSGMNSLEAALQAGATRLRPVLMTAGAMIIGMFPMALGLGEGGEQNAPLGRAVIGGLIVATLATLLFVPVVFSLLRAKGAVRNEEDEIEAAEKEQVAAAATVK
ncbi:MAG: efflux RND transporter permease subunit [Verrucomicrobiota bacterium]